jgi:hypothetical protein
MRIGTIVKRVGTAAAVMAAVVTLQATPALAEDVEGFLLAGPDQSDRFCSARSQVGTYHLRACMGFNPWGAGAIAFAFVTLEAGHSPCMIRGRLVANDRPLGLYVWPCPSGTASHLPLYVPVPVFNGTYYAAFSIQRTVPNDGVGPHAVSPEVRVTTTAPPPNPGTTQVTIG